MKLKLTVLALSLLCCSCMSSYRVRVKSKQYILHERVNEAGEELTYALIGGVDGLPTVTRTKKQKFNVATLGLRVRSINRELAESLTVRTSSDGETPGAPLSVTPWSGLRVDRVDGSSPASVAGIQTGDILLTLDGIDLSTDEQLKELLEAFIEPGAEITVTVLEVDADRLYSPQPTEMKVTLGSKEVDVTKADTIQLQSDVGVFHLTGLIVGSLPQELAVEIYGTPDPVTLVAGALVGSPAYLSGLRSGDRVVSCDGQPVTSYKDVSRAVLARSRTSKIPAEWFDPATRDGITKADGDLELRVEGPLGTHQTTMKVVHNINDRSQTYIPIVWDYYSDIHRTSWSFLDFIFQFGANYRTHYQASSTRAAQKDTSLSLFPFGMFEFETSSHVDRYRFFWFIRFEDKH